MRRRMFCSKAAVRENVQALMPEDLPAQAIVLPLRSPQETVAAFDYMSRYALITPWHVIVLTLDVLVRIQVEIS